MAHSNLHHYMDSIDFLNQNRLSYKELLFNFNDFVYNAPSNNRKNNIQKIMDTYPDCTDYYFKQIKKISKHYDYVGITNCTPDNWNRITHNDDMNKTIEQLVTKIPKPWNVSYNLVFNQVNWFENVLPHIEITPSSNNRVATFLPYSSNIAVSWSIYDKKNMVYFSFEITENNHSIEDYLKAASLFFANSYKSFDTFVYFDDEEVLKNKALEKIIQPVISKFDKALWSSSSQRKSLLVDSRPFSPQKAIRKFLKNTRFHYYGCENGLYSIAKIDAYNHQIKVYLDYANGCLTTAIRYTGLNFMYSFSLKDIHPRQQDDIENHIEYLLETIDHLETELFAKISSAYPATPSWFIYSNN